MELKDFKIPPECSRISIKAEGRVLTILFEPENPNIFFCQETGRTEEEPRVGQLAVLWDEMHNDAIISRVSDIDYKEFIYMASNGMWYRNAARFRDEEQYNKILFAEDDKKAEILKE